jgi:hypothetical protein
VARVPVGSRASGFDSPNFFCRGLWGKQGVAPSARVQIRGSGLSYGG